MYVCMYMWAGGGPRAEVHARPPDDCPFGKAWHTADFLSASPPPPESTPTRRKQEHQSGPLKPGHMR